MSRLTLGLAPRYSSPEVAHAAIQQYCQWVTQRTTRIATWSGVLALLLLVSGIVLPQATGELSWMLLMMFGGIGLVPAQWLQRRVRRLVGPASVLKVFSDTPHVIEDVRIIDRTFRQISVRELALTYRGATTSYPCETGDGWNRHSSRFDANDVREAWLVIVAASR